MDLEGRIEVLHSLGIPRVKPTIAITVTLDAPPTSRDCCRSGPECELCGAVAAGVSSGLHRRGSLSQSAKIPDTIAVDIFSFGLLLPNHILEPRTRLPARRMGVILSSGLGCCLVEFTGVPPTFNVFPEHDDAVVVITLAARRGSAVLLTQSQNDAVLSAHRIMRGGTAPHFYHAAIDIVLLGLAQIFRFRFSWHPRRPRRLAQSIQHRADNSPVPGGNTPSGPQRSQLRGPANRHVPVQ